MSRQNTRNRKPKASQADRVLARYADKIAALNAQVKSALVKSEMDYGALGALLEDAGNRYLDLAEDVRSRILVRRSKGYGPRSVRAAALSQC